MRSLELIFDDLFASGRKTWKDLNALCRVYKSLTADFPEAKTKYDKLVEENWAYHPSRDELIRRDQALWETTDIDDRTDHHDLVYLFDGSQDCYADKLGVFAECLIADKHLVCHFVKSALRSFDIVWDGREWWQARCHVTLNYQNNGRVIPEILVANVVATHVADIVRRACGNCSPQLAAVTQLVSASEIDPLLKTMCYFPASQGSYDTLLQIKEGTRYLPCCPDCGNSPESDDEDDD